jgi:hypothetical protein
VAGKLTGPAPRPRRPSQPFPTAIRKLRFTKEDIAQLYEAAEIDPVTATNPLNIASDLEGAFKSAAAIGQIDEGWASASAVAAYYTRVADTAEQLLFALGFSPADPASLPNPLVPFSTGSLLWLIPEFFGEPDGDWWRDAVPIAAPAVSPDKVASYVSFFQDRHLESGRPPKTPVEIHDLARAFAVREVLEIAPRAIAAVHALALGANGALTSGHPRDRLVQPRRGRGDRPDAIGRRLFDNLVQCYCDMFGRAPQTRKPGDRDSRDGPAARWVLQLMRIAGERIRAADGRSDGVARRILAITEQAPESLAVAMERAWKRKNGRKPPDQRDWG